MTELSPRQERILVYIHLFLADQRWPPTLREMCRGLSIPAPSDVKYHLDELVAKGYLERQPGARCIRLKAKGQFVVDAYLASQKRKEAASA